ncbi:Polyphenol oxidase, chloroplastic [Linum grandiflorum]
MLPSLISPATGAISGAHSLHRKSPQLSAFRSKTTYSGRVPRILCNIASRSNQDDNEKTPTTRRDLLIGMGGMYGVGSMSSENPAAFADPVPHPDFAKCNTSFIPQSGEDRECCPPFTGQNIVDFKLPSPLEPIRIRPAAHSVDKSYVRKYERAIQLMKSLPDDDPRSFKQQANVHCAYCNYAYEQTGFENIPIQIHASWLFFPFHRFYLHFFERILGKLIDDPTFALPYWNWDSPPGMSMPAMFTDPKSPLHNPLRNPDHYPPFLLDLNWTGIDAMVPPEELYKSNLSLMHTQMVSGATKASLFLGSALKAGEEALSTGEGTIERTVHGIVHVWAGDRTQPHFEDMGNFYSAGRDPMFYCHHTNVDRMWDLWKTLGPDRKDPTDPDWLEASFLFYDEDKNLVRCKVKDCVDSRKMNFDYQKVPIPWLRTKITPKTKITVVANAFGTEKSASAASIPHKRELTLLSSFPVVLNKTISVMVPRPKKSRNAIEKVNEEEILVVEGIELDRGEMAKFDVAINDEDDGAPAGPQDTEFAGTFVNVPHKEKAGAPTCKTSMKVGITSLLEDLDVDDDDTIIVTLTPKVGEVKIGGLKIDYITE